uniref:Secreted protein n=1 Tax=Cacopsylla melanoneura TaxID=428564 RepID=A0A8D8LPD9_9HEMI
MNRSLCSRCIISCVLVSLFNCSCSLTVARLYSSHSLPFLYVSAASSISVVESPPNIHFSLAFMQCLSSSVIHKKTGKGVSRGLGVRRVLFRSPRSKTKRESLLTSNVLSSLENNSKIKSLPRPGFEPASSGLPVRRSDH